MRAGAHIACALLCGQAVTVIISEPRLDAAIFYMLAGGIAGLLPDIDHENSKISRRFPHASFAIASRFGHRGVFHAPATYIPVSIFIGWLFMSDSPIGFGIWLSFTLGLLSHLFLDTLTPFGIMWLWPYKKKRYHLLSIKTGGLVEAFLFVLMLFVNFFLFLFVALVR